MQKREKFDAGVEAGRNDAALMIAEPGRPGRSRLRLLAARGLAAVLLVAFAALLALPSQAQAQTVTTLVDNSGLNPTLGSASFQAQSFGTGANAGGYTITEVQLPLAGSIASSATTVVKIREDGSGEPGDLVATLTNPATLTAGAFNTFTAPANTTLDAGTPYWITVNEGISVRANFSRTDEHVQTGEAGWTIGDARLYKSSESDDWSTSSLVLVMVVKGTVDGGTTTSTDATLSALALSGVTLSPVFAPATEGYTATVANSVTQTTVTATKNDSNATVAITNDDDTNTPNTATVNLSEGANTITVTVTAEDGSTTKTYTVMVTRNTPATGQTSITQTAEGATWTLTGYTSVEAGSTYTFTITLTSGSKPQNEYAGFHLPNTSDNQDKLGLDPNDCTSPKQFCASFTGGSNVTAIWDGIGGHDTISYILGGASPHTATATFKVATGTPEGAEIKFGALKNDGVPRGGGMIITVGGGTTTTTSNDATLSALALSGVTLSPMFAPATEGYTATVENSVTQTTVTATRNDSNATVAITNDDDTSTPNTATVNLSEGANTITVTVTAEDGNTTKTYTVVVTREAPTTTGACPADAVWCATLTVQSLDGGHRGCANSVPGKECSNTSHLTEDEFTHDGTGYAVTSVQVRSGGELRLFLNPDLTTATQSLVLLVGAERFAFADAVTQGVNYRYWNNTGLSWTSGDVVELKLAESTTTTTNTPATGKPKISGAAQVGRTLTAAIGTIADADGLPSSFTYQWVRVDGGAERNIAGATSKTYTLVQADAGKTFKVKVSFTDDAGNREGPLTSNEYPASGVKGELRLMNDNGPTTTGEGRLEVFFRGEWGTVCDDRFGRPFRPDPKDRQAPMVDSVAPQFACRLMGYATGAVVSRAGLGITSVSPEPEDGGPKIWLDDVLCKPAPTNWTGSTPRGLQHCHHAGWGLENCTHDEDVHLECSGALGQGEPAWMWGTAAQEAAEEALTAAFEDAPQNHDGSSAFTFRIAFSAEVEITPQDMRDHALTVIGGTVTAAARVDGRKDLWELTVEPAGSGPVSILTPLDRACTEAGALCTADGQALSTGLARSVPGPVAQGRHAATPLTAALSNLPAEHDGSHPFTFTLTFSENVTGLSYRTLRDDAFDVTGGGVTKAKRATKGGNQTWAMTVQPSGNGAVTVILPATTNCTASGAICTNDDRPLSNALAATIHGPVGISVADATVTEGAGAQLDFVVSLSRSATSTVTVDYFTRNGTAIAGRDYTATSGTLTFAAGETTRTVAVPVLDDAHDEGSETMKLKLTNASGARITDRKAIGTIVNSDPLQRAWLSRFGRTVAEQVLEAVGARIEGNSNSPGSTQLTLGGHQVVLGASWPRAEDTLLGDAGVLGQDLRERKYILRAEADESPAQEISTAGLLMASSLHLASADGGDGRWSLWARGSRSSFSGREDALTLKGDVSTGVMGADYERGRVLAGVALAYSTGEGSYTGADARGGEVESTLASAYPYLRYTVSERLSVWGVLGLGEGGLTLDIAAREADEANERIETDVSLAMSAFGARGKLASVGGYDLAVKTDVLFVRTESEAAAGLAAADARTRRLRLTLEGSREVKLESGVLTPSLEVGLRHDGGDAETGSGLELGGGLRWAGLKGFAVEVRARGLIAHEERDYEEWGVSASLVLSPGEGGRGLSMRVGSAWGAASGGVERLWSQRALTGGSFDPDARLDAEVGYGLGAMRGLLTPYTGVALSEGGETWRAGARFRLGSSLEVSLEASLTEPTGDGEPESGITLRGTKRW